MRGIVPRHDGEIVFVPDLAQMNREVEANAERLSDNEVVVLDKPLYTWRRACRTELTKQAQRYIASLALATEAIDPESPLIVTGHQAQFYHCGILIKYCLANVLARTFGTCPINLIVDSDLPGNLSLNLPVQDADRLSRYSLSWQNVSPNIPMEYQPLPSQREMDRWLDRL